MSFKDWKQNLKKKEMVIITPQEEIDKYFNSDALSQSVLKKLLGGIGNFLSNQEEEKDLFYSEKGHFIKGSAVDTLLTGEEGEFEKQYYVSTLTNKPSAVEMSITQRVFEEVKTEIELTSLSDYPGSLDNAITEEDWYGGKPGDKRIAGLIERCTPYFEDLKKSIGKQILTTEEHKLIKDIVFSLKSNPRTEKYFNRTALAKNPNVTVYYQLPIYFYYRGIYCKALLDMLIVTKNDDGKLISVEPIDLKTMNGSTLYFLSSLKTRRYDIQAAWYVKALISDNSSFILPLVEGSLTIESALKPFTFIVESNNFPGQPLVFEIDEEILNIGQFGIKELKVKSSLYNQEHVVIRAVTGFEELLDTYEYQNENDWKEEEIITKNDGVLKIDWNGIKN